MKSLRFTQYFENERDECKGGVISFLGGGGGNIEISHLLAVTVTPQSVNGSGLVVVLVRGGSHGCL